MPAWRSQTKVFGRPPSDQTPGDAPEQVRRLLGKDQRAGAGPRVAQTRDDHPGAALLEMPDRNRLRRLPQIELADLRRSIDRALETPRRRREQRPQLAQIVVQDRLGARVAERLDQLPDPLTGQLGILAQQPVDLVLERLQLRRPRRSHITRRFRRAQRPPNRITVTPGTPGDLLDRQPADEVHPPYLRPLLHLDQRPPPRPLDTRASEASAPPGHDAPTPEGGEISTGAPG
jgi:hypothetical protein